MSRRITRGLVSSMAALLAVGTATGFAYATAGGGGTLGVASASAAAPSAVVVPQGQPARVALAVPLSGPLAGFGASFVNAAHMAVELHPNVRGFPVEVDPFDANCFGTDSAAASAIVADTQILGVIGHVCSSDFAAALPIYEAAGVVTISGSATADFLPALGPTVFNRTVVSDGAGFATWYARVMALPSDIAWREAYTAEFGQPPTPFADLYYDATVLLLQRLHEVGTIDRGSLVVDRAALASAVRHTVGFRGVSCTITLDPTTGNRINDAAALDRCAQQTD
jgi:ABC-type branched-subunit amino acid transport system substrate-binding protein